MSEPLLAIRNHHSAACGDAPIVNTYDPDVYLGYFANSFGEQWIFLFNKNTRRAELRGGDVGWNTVQAVFDGQVEGLMLNPVESAWLQACWSAAAGP